VRPFLELKKKVETMAVRQLKKDGLDKDEQLTNEDSEFFNDPTAYAMHKMDFKVCGKCAMPFYAGLHECAAGPGGEQKEPVEVDESKILCMSCGNDGKFKCPKNHGDEFVVWKCRYG